MVASVVRILKHNIEIYKEKKGKLLEINRYY